MDNNNSTPDMPKDVAQAFSRIDAGVRPRLLAVRALIFAVAADIEAIGPLTETLKWGEPAYLTVASGSGTTIRLGVSKSFPGRAAVLFNCRTWLIEAFRRQFSDEFSFEGNRAIILPDDAQLPEAALALCLRAALTYHRTAEKRLIRQ